MKRLCIDPCTIMMEAASCSTVIVGFLMHRWDVWSKEGKKLNLENLAAEFHMLEGAQLELVKIFLGIIRLQS